jgi:putative transposase
MIMAWIEEAVSAGASRERACEMVGLDVRTVQRWTQRGACGDRRAGPKARPKNALSQAERQEVVALANKPEHRDLSPKQIVPRLADRGIYVASESSFYRILRAEGQVNHRQRSKPAEHARPRELVATAPNQVWTWDITYLPSPVKGEFYYLYTVLDIYSRKIVGWEVHREESADHATTLLESTYIREGVQRDQVALHQDNGGPMKCGTFLARLQELGVATSFSRPGVSDDNPYIEALFRTLKYRPEYPDRPFASLAAARDFVARFVIWYNTHHRHSDIRFVTPEQRHAGHDAAILARRQRVYEQARTRRPERWSCSTRNWTPIDRVVLNPGTTSAGEYAA